MQPNIVKNPVDSFNVVGELSYENKLKDIMNNYGITSYLYKKQLGYNIKNVPTNTDKKGLEITFKTDSATPLLADPKKFLNSGESMLNSPTIDRNISDPIMMNVDGNINVVAMQLKQLKEQVSQIERRQAAEIEGGRVYTSGLKIDPLEEVIDQNPYMIGNGSEENKQSTVFSPNVNNNNSYSINKNGFNLKQGQISYNDSMNLLMNKEGSIADARARAILQGDYNVHSPASYNTLNLSAQALNTDMRLTSINSINNNIINDNTNNSDNNGKLKIRIKNPVSEIPFINNNNNFNNDFNTNVNSNNQNVATKTTFKKFKQPMPHEPTNNVEGPFETEEGIEYFCDENGNPFYLDDDGEPYYVDEECRRFIIDDNNECIYIDPISEPTPVVEDAEGSIENDEEKEMEELYAITEEYLKETYPDLEQADIDDILNEIKSQPTIDQKKAMIEKLVEPDEEEPSVEQ